MASITYTQIEGRGGRYYLLLIVLAALTALGLGAAHVMEHEGHVVTGMSNQVVWGVPHVFAVFLIIAASGALNVASISSVFDGATYKPFARLSALLAVTLLIGGLVVLVLDLGRPDRLIVAMTTYNFKSIFAWNIFLYTGFAVVVLAYLWTMFEPTKGRYTKPVGIFAFCWRIILTTGTGSIFGFLVARDAYDAAIMAPMFIIMSLSFGTAIFLMVYLASCLERPKLRSQVLIGRLRRLLAVFAAAVLYIVLAYHVANLYATQHHDVERFILLDGGVYTFLFWVMQVIVGGLVPLAILLMPRFSADRWVVMAAVLIVVGGLSQLYVIIIGGQAIPQILFPGYEVASTFFDGEVASYVPSWPEFGLGLGGAAIALLLTVLALKVLPFLPAEVPGDDATGKAARA